MRCLLVFLVAWPLCGFADDGPVCLGHSAALAHSTLSSPQRLATAAPKPADPLWARGELWSGPRTGMGALARTERTGPARFDPSAGSWFAMANGTIARVDPSGGLVVVVHGVQGTDIDVRQAAHLAVSREPDDTIVLHRFSHRPDRRVLLGGAAFFEPRLSPDGAQVLVAQSRATGGHMWLLPVDGSAPPRDLGQGYGATWHPDGDRVIFCRVQHDGRRIQASDLWQMKVDGPSVAVRLAATPGIAEVEPAVSADGAWVAYVDAKTGDVLVAAMPEMEEVQP